MANTISSLEVGFSDAPGDRAQRLSFLQSDYCPPLDSALFFAIISDYDLENGSSVAQLRNTLDMLKLSALEQESIEFDPWGSNQQALSTEACEGGAKDGKLQGDSDKPRSEDTDISKVSNGVVSLGMSASGTASETEPDEDRSSQFEELAGSSAEEKKAYLMEIFPNLSDYHIAHTLKKCDNDPKRTIDELLNHVYLHGWASNEGKERIFAKGIDAFSDDNGMIRSRNQRNKSRKTYKRLGDYDRASSAPNTATVDGALKRSMWESATDDINLISLHTRKPKKFVSSLYHANGASMPATIYAILDLHSEDRPPSNSDDSRLQANASELGEEFPLIPSPYISALVRMTQPSSATAHELAKAIVATSRSNIRSGGIEIVRRYAPIELGASQNNPVAASASAEPVRPRAHGNVVAPNPSPWIAAQLASSQAQAAYRKSKSDHLMGGAASYYSAEARDLYAKATVQNALAADSLVASQSTADEIDLHGVDVKNAVRIAREKVTAWWAGQGEDRIRAHGQKATMKLVTGVGYHSEGGRGKIGPAVVKMLMREGWKVEAGTGVVFVTGVARKR